ncbi:MAG: ABC-type transport system, involved in lipoprotein release, permease component [Clostridia bacterium]|nr:ABC-type transport system, involved in lipoprotein release, permease component [Clostridia bacterium]
MGFLQAYKMAVKSIRNNKVRSFLTMLGVIIGVSSVIVAVAFAQGSTKSVTDSISQLGTNLIQINIVGRNSNRSISYDELKKFSEENSKDIAAIAPQVTSNGTVKYGTKNTETSIIGTSPAYEDIKSVHVQSGRFMLDMDVDYLQKVALVGTAVVNELFEGGNPLGQSIKINGQIFTIVGVLEERGSGQDQSEDDQIIIPVTVSQRLLQSAAIRNFSIQATTPETINSAMEKLNSLLFEVYKDETAYRVFNQAETLSTLNEVTDSMTAVLAGIAAISLVVGGIGIMNIMLVSVTERTREIGIRKAIGAKKKNILVQFLIEAVLVTGIGGCIGVMMGVGIIKFVIEGMDIVPAVYSVPWMLLSFGISLIVGVIFGMFPAYKAASLNPIEALRHE